jgi:hypothetical protein
VIFASNSPPQFRGADDTDLKGASVRVFGLPGMVMIACPPALTSGGAVGSLLPLRPLFQIPADQGERGGVAGTHVCHLAARDGKEKRGEPGEGAAPVSETTVADIGRGVRQAPRSNAPSLFGAIVN